ncbi:D-alanine--D-alanine ligase family protein [Limnochorda pilosa]|uniref:D-alanine--D-alanine ligase n=1 Tax=Limnochorda pilosa TaxID=1555112 RepID=A0A0K2SGF4_LIMPI|nr:D-alanine--D-alanine ligase [Limnochorda pilosa]BAS26127.1 D-alanine--D-alanine ligase [Limnochorda pilosa]
MAKPRVGVVCGGPSAEAEVSRVSGRGVAEALRATYEDVVVLELEPSISGRLQEERVDVVFPVLHGPPGEDGCFQGLLEILGLPYVGSGVLASACAMDKVTAKRLFRASGLPVAREVVVAPAERPAEAAERVRAELGADVVVKPARQGSAVGVGFGHDGTLEEALAQALHFGDAVLVEERVRGKEITVAVLERDDRVEALPVIEIRTPPGSWYDYPHRYTPGWSEHVIPAPLPEATYARTQEVACLAHQALGCRDLSRVDFVVPDSGEPVLLEVNTIPGMTPTSLYPDAARAAGISFEQLVAHLVERALARGGSRG